MAATDSYVDPGIPPVNTTNTMELRDALVIGCGGFGLLTAAHLRAKLGRYVDVNSLERIRFIGIDTATSLEREKYLILKHFDENHLHSIKASGELTDMIDHPESHPAIMETLPDIDELSDWGRSLLKEPVDTDQGAGTQRLYSRLCLRSEGKNISGLAERIEGRFSSSGFIHKDSPPPEITEHSSNWTYVFLATSLYGGTGAGIFADVAALCRKIAAEKKRTAFIIGIFYLPSFMDTNIAPHHKAQAYAALKELDHFLSGNTLAWRYPEGTRVEVTNVGGENKLFNMAFLVDVPPQADILKGQPKEKRNQLAENGAELIFHLCSTHVGENFYQRWVDLAAREGKFIKDYPELTYQQRAVRAVIEQRRTAYSTFRFKTVGVDQRGLRDYFMSRFAREVFEGFTSSKEKALEKAERIIRGAGGAPPLSTRLHLSIEGLQRHFATRLPQAEPGPELEQYIVGMGQRITNALDGIRTIAGGLPGLYLSNIKEEIVIALKNEGSEVADLVLGQLINHVQGDLVKAIEERQKSLQGYDAAGLDQQISQLVVMCGQAAGTVRARQAQGVLRRGFVGTIRLLGISRAQIGRRQRELLAIRMRPVAQAANRIAQQAVEHETLLRMHELANSLIPNQMRELQEDLVQPVRQRLKTVDEDLRREEQRTHPRAQWADSLSFTHVDRTNSQFVDRAWRRLCAELPVDLRPGAVATQLREGGLEVRIGERVTIERFVHEDAITVTNAIKRTVRDKISDYLNIWTVDFDNRDIFDYPPPPAPSDFSEICKQLSESKTPLLPYSIAGNQGVLNGVIAHSMTERTHTPNWLDLLGVQESFTGPVPGLVTAYTFALGFPLVALRDIRGWYVEYLREIHQRLPVHAIKSAVYMREPYFDVSFQPTQTARDLLFELATHPQIDQIRPCPGGGFVLGDAAEVQKLRSELRNLFWDTPNREAKGLAEGDFKLEMERNFVLCHTLRQRVFNTILMKILDESGLYHAFRWHDFMDEILNRHKGPSGIAPEIQDFFHRLDDDIRKAVSE